MPTHYEGISAATDPEAGFRAAAGKAVDSFTTQQGVPDPDSPVLLRVVDMYVKVHNPIHDYIVVLGADN